MLDTWVVVAVSVAYLGAAVRDRLLRRPPRRPSPQHHQQRLRLRPLARASTPRRGPTTAASGGRRPPASASCRSTSARRSWPRCGGWCCARSSHLQAEPHHLARRLRVLALRQEQRCSAAGHRHRGGRDRAVHRAAAEGDLHHLHDPARPSPTGRRGGAGPAAAARTPRCTSRCCSPPSRSCSAPATSTPPSGTRAWSPPSPSSRSSSSSRSSPSGCYVTFGLFGGFGDLFGRAAARPGPRPAAHASRRPTSYADLAVARSCCRCSRSCCCPGSGRSRWWRTSTSATSGRRCWLFPLYLLLINVFVLPIAIAGLLTFGDGGAGGGRLRAHAADGRRSSRRSRCSCSSAGCPRPPAW